MGSDLISGGNIEPRPLEQEMRTAYLDYAMSVIVGRALPDVRDGLKPVHRRGLYAEKELAPRPPRPRAQCAKIGLEGVGKHHTRSASPHYATPARQGQRISP